MLERLARFVVRHALLITIVALASAVAAAIYGAGVARALGASGFEVKGGEAMHVDETSAERFGHGEPDIIALVDRGSDPEVQADLADLVAELLRHPSVSAVDTPLGPAGAALMAKDGNTAMITINLIGDAVEKASAYEEIAAVLHRDDDRLDVLIAGPLAMAAVGQETAEHDLQRGELVAFPVVGVILMLFFRGRAATFLPLVVGGLAIAFATALLRGLAHVTDISIFSLNIITLLGLGLAIDYSLFIVQRFREELVETSPAEATVAAVITAGKTMLFSGVAVAISLLGLLAFPIALLHNIAVAGAIIVLLTMLASIVVLPALLALLGRRIDWPRARTSVVKPREGQGWARVAMWVMTRPILVTTITAALLLLLGTPMLGLHTGLSDARMFPPDSEVRRAQVVLDAPEGFGQAGQTRYVALLTADHPITDARVLGDLYDAHTALAAEPDVHRVDGLVSALAQPDRARFVAAGAMLGQMPTPPPGIDRFIDGEVALITIVADAPETARDRVRQIDRLRAIAGESFGVQLGGRGKLVSEVDQALLRGLAPAIGIVVAATLVILTLAFGAIVVSIKAVLMNVLSLSASFGALVFVFQHGRYEQLLHYSAAGAIDPLVLMIMFAIVFGLSMDYELFLLSRIREAYDETQDPHGSVATGLAATGRLFTMAALMLIVVLLGFGSGHMLFVKQLGLGMAFAVAVDATIVRALLVPASMRLLGRSNWWAPQWFARWWHRSGIGVRETITRPPADATPPLPDASADPTDETQ